MTRYIKPSYLKTSQNRVQTEKFHWLSSILILLCKNGAKQTHSPKTNCKDWFYFILALYKSINCICNWDQTIIYFFFKFYVRSFSLWCFSTEFQTCGAKGLKLLSPKVTLFCIGIFKSYFFQTEFLSFSK